MPEVPERSDVPAIKQYGACSAFKFRPYQVKLWHRIYFANRSLFEVTLKRHGNNEALAVLRRSVTLREHCRRDDKLLSDCSCSIDVATRWAPCFHRLSNLMAGFARLVLTWCTWSEIQSQELHSSSHLCENALFCPLLSGGHWGKYYQAPQRHNLFT